MAGFGAHPHMQTVSGPPPRVRDFLLSLVSPPTVQKYREAFARLLDYSVELNASFGSMTEEQQDYFIADCVLEMIDDGSSLQECRFVVAAAQKFYGNRRRFSTSYRVIDGVVLAQPSAAGGTFSSASSFCACGPALRCWAGRRGDRSLDGFLRSAPYQRGDQLAPR